jgi:hypothetical protein
VPYSEDFSQSFWTKQASVTLDKGYLAPDGTYNATKISGVIGSSYVVSQGGILSSSSTKSIWAKTISGTGVIHLGANQSQSNASFTITNEWQRFEVTGTTTDVYAVDFRNASTTLSEILVWGAQGENGSYATSYIPTSGSAVTRVAENAYKRSVTQAIGQSEGTMYIEFVPKDISTFQVLYQIRSSSGTVGQVDIRLQNGIINAIANDGGSNQFNMSGISYSAGTIYKVAVRYKLNDSKIYINGSSVGTDTSCSFTVSSLDQVSFSENTGGLKPIADISDARLYNTALTDQELIELTTI